MCYLIKFIGKARPARNFLRRAKKKFFLFSKRFTYLKKCFAFFCLDELIHF